VSKLYDRLLGLLAAFAAAGIAFVALAITYAVVLRQLFGAVPLWVNDVTSYLMVAITFAGGAYVLAHDGHTRVDILLNQIKGSARARLDLASALLGFLATAVLTGAGLYTVVDQYQRGTWVLRTIEVRTWIVLTPIVIGSALTAISFLRIAWQCWREGLRGQADQDSSC
jgi:TRAP-type C4-dicarboxylate transport system permease small subunit